MELRPFHAQPTFPSLPAKTPAVPQRQHTVLLSSEPLKFKVSLDNWFFLPLDKILFPYSSSLALTLRPGKNRTMCFLSSYHSPMGKRL